MPVGFVVAFGLYVFCVCFVRWLVFLLAAVRSIVSAYFNRKRNQSNNGHVIDMTEEFNKNDSISDFLLSGSGWVSKKLFRILDDAGNVTLLERTPAGSLLYGGGSVHCHQRISSTNDKSGGIVQIVL